MSYPKKFITLAHLEWAMENRVIITEGEVGFGRDCVGVSAGTFWIDWRANKGSPTWEEIPGAYDGFIPDGAYHKHDCVCVLGQSDESWMMLAMWLDHIVQDGWMVLHGDRTPENAIDLLFHGTTTARLSRIGN